MKTFYILSPDELNQIEVTGQSLEDAVQSAKEISMNAIMFFEEYSLESCYVEELENQ